ncbi:hypothetical protein PN462_22130 [Spirulina sp. CS-785/01]|uniref:hypothetical protein n=1 Tax=Spirulina sp. CS-785/01 TaxID=3021716 RepID=UPI00232DA221|nr:hypothetical protein [Spirulina sp. CS-785/01]MDB9315826.1 hypothetical protein [Spirulina sp. CS-785/01]
MAVSNCEVVGKWRMIRMISRKSLNRSFQERRELNQDTMMGKSQWAYRPTSEHQLDLGQSLAVADVMGMLSEFSPDLLPLEPPPTSDPPPSPTLTPVTPPATLREPIPTPARLQEKTVSELAQEVWELKLVALSDSDYYNRQFNRLKRRLWGLTGFSVCAIAALGWGFSWTASSLNSSQTQLTRLEQGLESQRDRVTQLNQQHLPHLEQQINQLAGQVPDSLTKDLTQTQQELTQLQGEIEQMETEISANDQAVSLILNLLDRLSRRAPTPQNAPPSPENSSPR